MWSGKEGGGFKSYDLPRAFLIWSGVMGSRNNLTPVSYKNSLLGELNMAKAKFYAKRKDMRA